MYKNKNLSTLRVFKLCICNVNKCKVVAVGSRHVEVGFRLIDILDSNKRKRKQEKYTECHVKMIYLIRPTKSSYEHRIKTRKTTKVFDIQIIT